MGVVYYTAIGNQNNFYFELLLWTRQKHLFFPFTEIVTYTKFESVWPSLWFLTNRCDRGDILSLGLKTLVCFCSFFQKLWNIKNWVIPADPSGWAPSWPQTYLQGQLRSAESRPNQKSPPSWIQPKLPTQRITN